MEFYLTSKNNLTPHYCYRNIILFLFFKVIANIQNLMITVTILTISI